MDGGQRAACRSRFSPTMRVSGSELRPSGLAARTFDLLSHLSGSSTMLESLFGGSSSSPELLIMSLTGEQSSLQGTKYQALADRHMKY